MNKIETLRYLDQHQINYEKIDHPAVFNMADLANLHLPHPEADAKNLFIRDDQKKHYYLLTVKGNKKVNLQQFRQKFGTRRLTFASPEDLKKFLQVTPGSVTPLALLNNVDVQIPLYLDAYFLKQPLIGMHPNDNTATIWLNSGDLINLIKEHGNPVYVTKIMSD